MLAYSASRVRAGGRSSNPNMMLAIVGIHVAAVAVLMNAKMDLPLPISRTPLTVEFIEPKPPEPVEIPEPSKRPPPDRSLSVPKPFVPLPSPPDVLPAPDPLPPLDKAVPDSGASNRPSSGDVARPIRATPALLLTGAAELKPPYPASKLAGGEEADLKLRLTVDERGRVRAVEPLGRADSTFLSAARRHIMAHWRYRPATSDGRGVTTSLVITLRFRLDDG